MSTTIIEGRGTSKPTTADEQNATRRAAKARQKKNRGQGRRSGDTGFRTGLNTDRRLRREAAQAKRSAQAKEALKIANSDSTLRSPARELVLSTLEVWATTVPTSKEQSRTRAALEAVLSTLDAKPSDGVVRFACHYAGQALHRAFDAIQTEKALELDSFPAVYTCS